MVDQNGAYLFRKRGIYYFSKRIPSDLKHLYRVERLTQSLRSHKYLILSTLIIFISIDNIHFFSYTSSITNRFLRYPMI
jgi:hypothetical protein